jgi:hypothetical protein
MEIDKNVFLDKTIKNNDQEYKIIEFIAKGQVGYMFRCRNKNLDEDRAIKFIPQTLENPLKQGWENEITKTLNYDNKKMLSNITPTIFVQLIIRNIYI